MEFRALGQLSVLRDGDALELGGSKPRAVLALLLMHRNSVVRTDRILHELWGEDDTGKINALRVHISRLRSALDPDRARGEDSILETVDNGYRLVVTDDQYDVARFEAAVQSGRDALRADPALAAELLRSALQLWTGEAFDDFTDEPFAEADRRRLSELQIGAIEDRIEADLATGQAGSLVSELEDLRLRHPLREGFVCHQALALYRSGRPAEALRAIDRFRRYVGEELGIDPTPKLMRLEEQILLHDDRIQPSAQDSEQTIDPSAAAVNPFKGLRAFGTSDAASFFGRDALVAELLRRIGRDQRLVTLVGASGSGKSSVVRAGLIPTLAKGAIDGSDTWLIASMVPGSHPFAELEAALLRSTIDAPASLAEQLDDGEAGLLRAVLRLLPSDDSHLVLVIDQFEELFTLVGDTTVLDRFLANLVTAVDDPHGRITVVLTLRADFYERPLAHPAFGARLSDGIVNVTPMTPEELEAAALLPAEQQGVDIEPALLAHLISSVTGQNGALPLFQFALTELFDRRSGATITTSSYRSMGGLDGALRRRATDLHDELDAAHQAALRQLFLRLAVVSEEDHRTRRRVPAREIATIDVDPAVTQHVIKRFGEARLLSFDADPLTGAPTVEVAHEALLTAWPLLDQWIEEGRDDLRRHARLATALREWELGDRHPDYLLPSARVGEFETLHQSSSISLNDAEREFVQASIEHVSTLRELEARRRADEARKRNRLWAAVAALGALLGVAGLFLFGVIGGSDPAEVTFFGNRDDRGWNASMASGLDRAARERDITVVDVPWIVNPGLEFRELMEADPTIVVSDASGYTQSPTVIRDHPEVQFGIVDVEVHAPNVTSVTFANEEGAFLAGAAAALKTETGVVGFIGAQRISLVNEFRAGFEAGVAEVDPTVEVIAVLVDQFGGINGFARPELAEARAHALFERDVDVVFTAAGFSGFGVFEAALDYSNDSGRHVWAIGVDNDQWFQVPAVQRPHVLTSVIKRGDVATYRLINHMLDGGSTGLIGTLGIADDAFGYSSTGDGLTPQMRAELDRLSAEIAAGRIVVPATPSGGILLVDEDGVEIEQRDDVPLVAGAVGTDGLVIADDVEPGVVSLAALGTTIELTFDEGWAVARNQLGDTAFIYRSGLDFGTSSLALFRPHVMADPTDNEAPPVPADDIDEWLDMVVGIEPEARGSTEIAGRAATYFEVEIDRAACGSQSWCFGFVASSTTQGNIAGWPFEPGFRSRIWWVEQGDEAPLVIVKSTLSNDAEGEAAVDELLATIEIGDPLPHPLPFEDSGF